MRKTLEQAEEEGSCLAGSLPASVIQLHPLRKRKASTILLVQLQDEGNVLCLLFC